MPVRRDCAQDIDLSEFKNHVNTDVDARSLRALGAIDAGSWCSKTLVRHNASLSSLGGDNSHWGNMTEGTKLEWLQRDCDDLLTRDTETWCNAVRTKYNIQIGHVRNATSGKTRTDMKATPVAVREEWKIHLCDHMFKPDGSNKMYIKRCGTAQMVLNRTEAKTASASLPLIAVMAGSTTRGIKDPSFTNLALFKFLLPSFAKSIDCGFRYLFMIGYDHGDPFYEPTKKGSAAVHNVRIITRGGSNGNGSGSDSTNSGKVAVQNWFREHISLPLEQKGVSAQLAFTAVNNTLRKPGPVFNAMARNIYDHYKADYYYRINDDTELVDRWPTIFVQTLQQMKPPYGVVGPNCRQGNKHILTHDFVHKTHMDIFKMNYYPPVFVDWYMDTWISFVYGPYRTVRPPNIEVFHHTAEHGRRYEVDRRHKNLMDGIMKSSRELVREWMVARQATDKTMEAEIALFDSLSLDRFEIPTKINVVNKTKTKTTAGV